jgi:cobalamin-dependent methionine synthase I
MAICTIGGELEEACARSQAAGETLPALLLDSIGSAAAEAAADALNALVCDEALRLGLGTEGRESPGYGAWDISFQPRLLELLPARELGVSLTPGLMMMPRKSVSFAVRLTDRPQQAGSRCDRCNLTTCRHRRVDSAMGLEPV